MSPLTFAADRGRENIVRLLLKAGAMPNLQDEVQMLHHDTIHISTNEAENEDVLLAMVAVQLVHETRKSTIFSLVCV